MRVLMMATMLIAAPAVAQEGARTPVSQTESGSPQRIRSVTLAPGERCPASSSDEVVVCYQGGSPFRIPPQLRREEIPTANQSWVNRAATVDQVSRVSGGLPDTCSPVGTGGQSGCALARNREYAADKAERARVERVTPGGGE